MEKQQTTVEWLIDTINKINHNYEVGIIDEALWSIQTYDAHKQAKEMEKEQMCKFAYKCHNHYKVYGDFKIEQYYNETFKSE
jgi:hypothetical protein